MKAATMIPADAVTVQMEEPVLIDQAGPEVKTWGPYRMPKVFRMPNGELCLTFAIGLDLYEDQGMTGPAFVSNDNGHSWRKSAWPHPGISGMNPLIMPIHDGEYYCIPAGKGIELDLSKLPKPAGKYKAYAGGPIYWLKDLPDDAIRWFKDIRAMRWTPTTKAWTQESVKWDHNGQLIFTRELGGDWTNKVYFESPVVRSGKELLHADYWTVYESKPGQPPLDWQCWLMASTDNGRSWKRRGCMATISEKNDCTGEPVIEMNLSNELVGVLRRDVGSLEPMYLVHSNDRGYSWSEPQTLFDFGVFPRLLQMGNGVLVLSFGRPGVWLSFSLDGGHSWTQPQAIIEGDRNNSAQHSCGYTSLLALSKDTFLIAYGNFEFPNAKGEPCKTILVRRVTVTS
jgi:hypothetical protein